LSEAIVFVRRPVKWKMGKQMSPLIEKLIANNLESSTLATLRDTLLPNYFQGNQLGEIEQ